MGKKHSRISETILSNSDKLQSHCAALAYYPPATATLTQPFTGRPPKQNLASESSTTIRNLEVNSVKDQCLCLDSLTPNEG